MEFGIKPGTKALYSNHTCIIQRDPSKESTQSDLSSSDSMVKSSPHRNFYQQNLGSSNFANQRYKPKPAPSITRCAYCRNNNKETLIKCISAECNRFFCNENLVKNTEMSHIVAHLKEAKHNIIEIAKNPKGLRSHLNCHFCGNQNIFSLGFWRSGRTIICRVPCLMSKNDDNPKNFEPLIQGQMLNPKLFMSKSKYKKKNFDYPCEVTIKQIKRIENGTAARMKTEKSCFRIRKVYENSYQYSNIFTHLISLESSEESINKVLHYREVRLYFEENESLIEKHKSRTHAFFFGLEIGCKFTQKDVIIVTSQTGWDSKAKVISRDAGCFILELEVPAPKHIEIVDMLLENDSVCKNRMIKALESIKSLNNESKIQKIVLGYKVGFETCVDLKIKDYTVNGKFKLNNSQIEAIKLALENHVSIIHGPPGTGKTNTIVTLVYHLENLCRPKSNIDDDCIISASNNKYSTASYFTKSSKILVCAASNSPLFYLREKLEKIGLNTIQVLARSKEEEFKSTEGTLRYLTDIELEKDEKYQEIFEKQQEESKKNDPDEKKLEKLEEQLYSIRRKLEDRIIQQYDIICCTCTTTANSIFSKIDFEFVIVDEATQALEPEIIMCLNKNAKHLVLVGDRLQLGSMVSSVSARDLGLDISMIERFEDLSVPYKMLDVQYRMDPLIAKFSNKIFYSNQIKNFYPSKKYGSFSFPSPVSGSTFFYDIDSTEEYSGSGGSYVNRYEAEAIVSLINYLKENRVPPKKIGVITFYDGQKGYLIQFLKKRIDSEYAEEVEIMSVDASQGREKGFIILSCVRSNQKQGVGFLSEPRRLNVALTRAKYGLIVCGNVQTLLKNSLWAELIKFFNDQGLVYTGLLDCLKQEQLMIQNFKKFENNRRKKYADD